MRNYFIAYIYLLISVFCGTAYTQQSECYRIINIDVVSFKDYNLISLESYTQDTLFMLSSKIDYDTSYTNNRPDDTVVAGRCYALVLDKKDSLFTVDVSSRFAAIGNMEIDICQKMIYRNQKMQIGIYLSDQLDGLHYKNMPPGSPNNCSSDIDSTDFKTLDSTEIPSGCLLTQNIDAYIAVVETNPRSFVHDNRYDGSCVRAFVDTLTSLYLSTSDLKYLNCLNGLSTVSYAYLTKYLIDACGRLYKEKFMDFFKFVYEKRNMHCNCYLDKFFEIALEKEMNNQTNWDELKTSLFRQADDGNCSELQKYFLKQLVKKAEILKEIE